MMAESNITPNSAPELQDKAARAPGILPKNAQTWVIVSISAIMVLVIAFSSSGSPSPKAKTTVTSGAAATPPNQKQIEQYKAMVDEEARKLAAERQRLDQAKTEAMNAASNAELAGLGQANASANPYTVQPTLQQPVNQTPQKSPEEIQRITMEAERRKLEYSSLFASNLSLSLRNGQDRSTQESSATSDPQETPARVTPTTAAGVAKPEAKARDRRGDDVSLQKADGKKYRLFEGTVIETVLTNRLNGSFSGPVNAMVTTNVYSHDHQQLLIPQGSRALGEVQKVNSLGQQRLAVMFHRLVMPDGYSISLDQFHGLNQIGETGIRDQVNHHYFQIFGVSLAIGAIAGVEQAGASYGASTTGLDSYRQGVSSSLSQSALQILDKFLNILPTFVIREGHRIKVYLTDDLLVPAYDQHTLPSDL
jgi:type IV secretion system protein VirB10